MYEKLNYSNMKLNLKLLSLIKEKKTASKIESRDEGKWSPSGDKINLNKDLLVEKL